MSTVDVLVYDGTGSTLLAPTPVDGVLAVSCIDELDNVGGGSVTVALTSATLAAYPTLLTYRNVIKVRVDGTIRGAFIIKKRSEVIVGDGADASLAITVSGPGLLDWLKDAVVYPESPSPFAKSVRHFNYGSKRSAWLDTSQWGFASNVRQRGGADLTATTNPWRNRPVNWPGCSPAAWWIWDRSTASVTAPIGFCYFRRGFTTATAGTRYRVYFAADNQCALMLDGESLVSLPATADAYSRTWFADFVCDTGDHVMGWKVRNLGGPAGLLAALFTVTTDAEDREVLTQVLHTGDGAWRVNSYPTTEPGWTIGQILSQLITEADSRGVPSVVRLTPSWSALTDSEGVSWPRVPWRVDVGTSMFDAFASLKDSGCDLKVDPSTLAIGAYVSRGVSNLDVTIDAAAHIQDLTEEAEAAVTNALLIATGDQWAGARDSTSQSTYGRIEGYVDLSRFTAEQAVEVTRAILDRAKIPTEGAEVTYVPVSGNTPWVDFGVGDTVSVSTSSGFRSRIVSSISVAMDEAGAAVYTVELDTIFRDLLAKLQRIIEQAGLVSGSVPGQAGSPGGSNNGGGAGPGGGGGSGGGSGGGGSGGGGGGSGPYQPPGWNGAPYVPDDDWPGGGDPSFSGDPYLEGPGWNPGDPYGGGLPGFSGGGGGGPVLSPPGGEAGSGVGGTDPSTDPWLPPTDPGGGSTSADGTVAGVAPVARFVAAAQSSYFSDNGDFEVALLTGEPSVTSGEWDADLTSVELTTGTAPGYARATLDNTGIAAATGSTPVVRSTTVAIQFPPNSSAADWPPVTHIGLIATGLADALISVIPLAVPLVVAANTAASIAAGGLTFEGASR